MDLSAQLLAILWLAIPLGLYLIPSMAMDRHADGLQIKLSKWIVYLVPALAWIVSVYVRGRAGTSMGPGNAVLEPLFLSIAPISFFAIRAASQRVKPQEDTTWPELALIGAIAVAVIGAGILIPESGDWP